VLDEGFIHRTVQLHSSTVEVPEAATIDTYADLVPQPELLVHVRAPIDVCERRVRSRGVWDRFRSEDPSDLSRFVANAHRATTLIASAAEARGWRVVEIDNGEGDRAHAEAALRSRIQAALEERARWGSGQ
jgi:thymidylate kinase